MRRLEPIDRKHATHGASMFEDPNPFVIIATLALLLVFWLWPIVIIMGSAEGDYDQPTDRVLWFIIVFFLPVLGGICFFIFRVMGVVGSNSKMFGPSSLEPKSRTHEPKDLWRAGDQ